MNNFSNYGNSMLFNQDDLKALENIKKITHKGHNAEVKEKDGMLVVYEVDKRIAK